MKIVKYPDGSSYADLGEAGVSHFTMRINSYEDLWHLNQIVEAHNHLGITPSVTIPNLIDAQADRRFGLTQSHGLKLVLDFLNRMNATFTIFHPHNPDIVTAVLGEKVAIKSNRDFIKDVLLDLEYETSGQLVRRTNDGGIGYESDQLILMSSDAGGFKPLISLCDKIGWRGETFSASKARSWDSETKQAKFIQQIDKADFGGKHILIIDDLCVYGGTFKGIAKLLKERNCGQLILAVSHMTMQDLGEDPVTNYFTEVYTTNSKFDDYMAAEPKKERWVHPTNITVFNKFQPIKL